MSIIKKQSSIDNVAFDVFSQNRPFIMPEIKLTLHTKEQDIPIDLVTDVRVSRNFAVNITDVIFLEFMITAGTFQEKIFPNREDLEVTINFNYDNKAIRRLNYKLLITTKNPEVNNSHTHKVDEGDQDTQDLYTIKAQCVDKLTLNLKNQYISGIYHNYDLKYFMRSLINYEILAQSVTHKIMVYDLDNKKKYKNIVVKPYTKLIKLPYILHNDMYGLYDNGVNIYFTKIRYGGEYKVYPSPANKKNPEYLFGTGDNYDIEIFPLYDTTRYDKDTKRHKLLVVSPSVKAMGVNENDFYYKDGVFKLTIADVTFSTDEEKRQYEIGTTLATTNSSDILVSDGYDIKDDKITYPDSDHNGLETLPNKPTTFDTIFDMDNDYNIHKYRSILNKNEVILGVMKTGSINPDFIFPGMSFKYVFDKDNVIKETTGIIQSVEYYYDIANKTTVVAIAALFKKIKGWKW